MGVIDGKLTHGYESPCGVMSRWAVLMQCGQGQLRLPMRGYEIIIEGSETEIDIVTNPHAGL